MAMAEQSDRTASHEMTLEWKDGRCERLEVAGDETVVEAARSRGIVLPTGCLTGTCGTCAGLILEAPGVDAGEGPEEVFAYRRPPRALGEAARRRGYVLLCIAEPRAACRLAVGAATWTRREESPWG